MRTAIAALGILLAMSVCSTGGAQTVSLQEGVSGYSGCVDSYFTTGGYSDDSGGNYGECPQAIVSSYHYYSG